MEGWECQDGLVRPECARGPGDVFSHERQEAGDTVCARERLDIRQSRADRSLASLLPVGYERLSGLELRSSETHSLRHNYRSWLDAAETPIVVQQKLRRHSDIRTTLNVYGDVVANEMAQANSKVALSRAN